MNAKEGEATAPCDALSSIAMAEFFTKHIFIFLLFSLLNIVDRHRQHIFFPSTRVRFRDRGAANEMKMGKGTRRKTASNVWCGVWS